MLQSCTLYWVSKRHPKEWAAFFSEIRNKKKYLPAKGVGRGSLSFRVLDQGGGSAGPLARALALSASWGEGATDCGPAPRPVYKQHFLPSTRPTQSARLPSALELSLNRLSHSSAIFSCFTLLSCSLNHLKLSASTNITYTHHTRPRNTSRRNGSCCFRRRSREEGFQAQG
jgi:hypothetical protein